MAKSKSKVLFICQNCGAHSPKWQGRCPECNQWNSFVEEIAVQPDQSLSNRGWAISAASDSGTLQTITLDQKVQEIKHLRYATSFSEVDRVLGGGLVPGSFVLLGGDPGIGKSTILMQMAGGLAKQDLHVLYASAEESVSQTALRAQRLGVKSSNVEIASESNLELLVELVKKKSPDILIVDSIQTVFLPNLQSAPGSVSQVRESAAYLMALAKNQNISIFIVGHVTKEGTIAGPKVLEHMVDTVLSFEGDPGHQFRLLRALKNRFGATHELGVFQMVNEGLKEVLNPSELFLEERGETLVGSSVFAAMEGTRPLLCEVQALTVKSFMATPRRTGIGFDSQRTSLLSAVLDKHLDLDLAHHDVFINVVGGLKLEEPAADLSVAAAIISSTQDFDVPPKMAFVGEVGLTGEVRAIAFSEIRVREAFKLGFTAIVLPESNRKHLKSSGFDASKLLYVKNLRDLQNILSRKPRSANRPVPI